MRKYFLVSRADVHKKLKNTDWELSVAGTLIGTEFDGYTHVTILGDASFQIRCIATLLFFVSVILRCSGQIWS